MKLSAYLALLPAAIAFAQPPQNPVTWTAAAEPQSIAPGGTARVRVQAALQPGWHIYSLTTPVGGPTPTTIKLGPDAPATKLKLFQPSPVTKFDNTFQVDTEIFEREVAFLAEASIPPDAKGKTLDIPFAVRYQACTETQCLPKKAALSVSLSLTGGSASALPERPAGYSEAVGRTKSSSPKTASASAASTSPEGLASFLALAFGFGLAAIFTPCVFPMIPITLSFFLNRPGITRGESLRQAGVFCLGIIVLFTTIGLSIAAIAGPFGVIQLGSNPWVNGFIALVFFVFGLSLLGAFELTLPSSMLTKLDQASQRGGIFGTLLMGLTFALTSFACVGPFVGTLLAGSVQRGGIQPALGMVTFSAGLSTPFFVLALFPAYLQRLPRSGGWLARVKIVLGFVILAAMLKYLSSVDQVLRWNLLTRERFLAAWFVLFSLAGLYLLGLLRMEGVRSDETVGVGRVLSGAVLLIFALSLLPGMFGGPLGELDSYVPLAAAGSSPGFNRKGVEETAWLQNDLDGALAKARQENKRLLVTFTGYACTNCHWMKANMFSKPEIAALLKDYVLVELYTDSTDAVSERNQKLQESKFQTVAIPFYAVLDTEQRVIASFPSLTRNTTEFQAFLRAGSAAASVTARL